MPKIEKRTKVSGYIMKNQAAKSLHNFPEKCQSVGHYTLLKYRYNNLF